jgi:alpha-L-fucosidase 2
MYTGGWTNWTAGGGWLAQHFFDYWLFTGDVEFLKNRAVPFLREVALFYEDFLFEGRDGKLVFSPSLSPENIPARSGASHCQINATMDVAIARESFTNLCSACELLHIDAEGVSRWKRILANLPDYRTNDDGAIREWLHHDLPDNYHHRHLSHIYPLFPGFEVMQESAPELFEACRVAVEKRLVIGLSSQSGWSYAHMGNIYARIGEGERALECLENLCRSVVGSNLFTYHNDWRQQGLTVGWFGAAPPFQIDANFGIAAAVLEMLVFSAPGMIKILPALPRSWETGSVRGIACRGGFTVSVIWDTPHHRYDLILSSQTGGVVNVKFPGPVTAVAVFDDAPAVSDSTLGPEYREVRLEPNGGVRLVVHTEPSAG